MDFSKSIEDLKNEEISSIRKISGKLIDKETNKPIKGCKIRMKLDPNNDLLTYSDENGYFELQLTDFIIFYQGILKTPENYKPIENKPPSVAFTKVNPKDIDESSFQNVKLDFIPNNFSGYYTDEPPNPGFEAEMPNALYNTPRTAIFMVDTYGTEREEKLKNLYDNQGIDIKNEKSLEIRLKKEGDKYKFDLWYPEIIDSEGTILLPSGSAIESLPYEKERFIEAEEGDKYRVKGSTSIQTKSPPKDVTLPSGFKVGDIIIQDTKATGETDYNTLTHRYVIDVDFVARALPTKIINAKKIVDRTATGELHQHYKWLIDKRDRQNLFNENLKAYIEMQADNITFPTDISDATLKITKTEALKLIGGDVDIMINFMLQRDYREKAASLGLESTGTGGKRIKKVTSTRIGNIAKILPYQDMRGIEIDQTSLTKDQLNSIRAYEPPQPKQVAKKPALQDFINQINEGIKVYNDKGKFSIKELIIKQPEVVFDNVQLNFISPSLEEVYKSKEYQVLPINVKKEIKARTRITITGEDTAVWIPSPPIGPYRSGLAPVFGDRKLYNNKKIGEDGKEHDINWILAINGTGGWKYNLGSLVMMMEEPQRGLEKVKKKKYIVKNDITREDIKDALMQLLNDLVRLANDKIMEALYAMLEQFGIKDPQMIIDTLKEFREIIKEAAADAKEKKKDKGEGGDIEGETVPYDPYKGDPADSSTIVEFLTGSIEGGVENIEGAAGQTATSIAELPSDLSALKDMEDEVKEKFLQDMGMQIKVLAQRGLLNFPKKCPKKGGVLENLINMRNDLSPPIEKIQKTVNTVYTTIRTFETLIETYQTAIIAIVLAYKVMPIPLTYATSGVMSAIMDAKDELIKNSEKAIKKFEQKIGPLVKKLPQILSILDKIQAIMALLDYLIGDCAASKNLGTINLTPILIKAKEPTPLTIGNKPPPILEYKGFTFEIKVKSETDGLQRRYAQALGAAGNVILEGSPSYSSNEQILINELIFQIEFNNLQAI